MMASYTIFTPASINHETLVSAFGQLQGLTSYFTGSFDISFLFEVALVSLLLPKPSQCSPGGEIQPSWDILGPILCHRGGEVDVCCVTNVLATTA